MRPYIPTDWILYYTRNTHRLLHVCHFGDSVDLYRILILLLVYLDIFFVWKKEEGLLVFEGCEMRNERHCVYFRAHGYGKIGALLKNI